MKTKNVILALLLAFLLVGTAYAQDMRSVSPSLRVSFSGTTATCYVNIPGAHGDDVIDATIELRCGKQSVERWNEQAVGFLDFHEDALVIKGKTYDLEVEYTVNGKVQPSISCSGTCY